MFHPLYPFAFITLTGLYKEYMRAVCKVRGLAAVRRCSEGGGDPCAKL